MSELYPVSESYTAPESYKVVDIPLNSHYKGWRYSLAEIVKQDGTSTPEGGNTVVFRLTPGAMTEPVLVTKQQSEATFTVNVVSGKGKLIRSNAAGEVEHSTMLPGTQVVIRPGDAYSYHNDGPGDLLLYDAALPAFEEGDDAQLYVLPARPLEQRAGYTACEITTNGEQSVAYIPQEFTDLIAQAMRSTAA